MLSQDFIEKIILLVATALLTGFLVPYVLKIIDARKVKEQKEIDGRKAREQKVFEAALTRQARIIESQVQLLDKLTKAVWEFQLLAIAVSYYEPLQDEILYLAAGAYQFLGNQIRTNNCEVEFIEFLSALFLNTFGFFRTCQFFDMHPLAALKKYDENVASILVKIRTEISKSLRLAPPSSYTALSELYYKDLLPLDPRLRGLIEKRAAKSNARQEWHEFNTFAVFELSERVDAVINTLAKDLGLKESNGQDADRGTAFRDTA